MSLMERRTLPDEAAVMGIMIVSTCCEMIDFISVVLRVRTEL